MPRKKHTVNCPIDACAFCARKDTTPLLGDLLDKAGVRFHVNCVFTASGLVQSKDDCQTDDDHIMGFDVGAIKREIKRGRPLTCSQCRFGGACIGCTVQKCHSSFHLPCVVKAGGVTIFKDIFPSFCKRHVSIQNLDPWLEACIEVPSCCICLFSMVPDADNDGKTKSNIPSRPIKTSPRTQTPATLKRTMTRRSSMQMSTPKRIKVSIHCETQLSVSNTTLNVSNTNSMWQVSDQSYLPERDQSKSRDFLEPLPSSSALTTTPSPSNLKYGIPQWLYNHLSSKEGKFQAAHKSWLHTSIHGLCCPKAWMHRECITGYAVTAALHYLKCPYCGDKERFIDSIVEAGIWVPDRDAAWELEPGAYAELADIDDEGEDEKENCTNVSDAIQSSASCFNLSNETTLSEATPTPRRQHRRSTIRGCRRLPQMSSTASPQPEKKSPEPREKDIMSLVWTNRPSRGRLTTMSAPRNSRRHTQLTKVIHPKSPPNISMPPRGRPRRRTLQPQSGTDDAEKAPRVVTTSDIPRLRQVTLSSLFSNYHISPTR